MSLLLPPPAGGPQFTAGSRPHGNLATQDLDVLIQQPLQFCTGGIFARMRQASATQTLAGNANAIITYDTVDEDPYGGWNGSPNWYWKAPAGCSGWYHVSATVTATFSSAAQMRTMVFITTQYLYTLKQDNPASPLAQSGSALVYLFGGIDYVQVQAFAYSSGLTTSIAAGQQSSLQVSFVSNLGSLRRRRGVSVLNEPTNGELARRLDDIQRLLVGAPEYTADKRALDYRLTELGRELADERQARAAAIAQERAERAADVKAVHERISAEAKAGAEHRMHWRALLMTGALPAAVALIGVLVSLYLARHGGGGH